MSSVVRGAFWDAIPARPEIASRAESSTSVGRFCMAVSLCLHRGERLEIFGAALVQLQHAVIRRGERLSLERAGAVRPDLGDDVADAGGLDQREDPLPVEIP